MKHAGFWRTLVMVSAFASPAWSEGESAKTVVATVNGAEITLGHMIAMRENLPSEYQSLPDDVLFKGIFEQLIQQEVLAQSVTELTPRYLSTIDNDKRGFVSGAAIEAVVTEAVTEAALQAAYDARFKGAKLQTEFNAAHILVATLEEAEKLKAEIAAGADFADLARAHSTDSGSGANGGDLGWFGQGVMVKPFEDAVVAAKVGDVSEPVQSDFGYHLILVRETRAASQPTLDQLRDELAAEVERSAVDARINELTEAATVTREGEALDPSILKDSTLID